MIKHILLSVTILAACSQAEKPGSINKPPPPPQPIQPNKVMQVAFLIVDGVYNSELVAPMDILHHTVFHTDKGMRVFTIAPDTLPVTSFEGLRIIPDYSFQSDQLPDIDILVVPSAEHSMDTDLENESMIDFVRKTGQSASYVMSLCDGAFVLAKAGLVDGKESTTFPSDIERYRKTFPHLDVHEGVSFVHDGKLITSVGGAKSYDPALYLSELFYGKKVAQGLARGLVID
ncbi:MAG: DJ-1/PfpI family protein, partial [Fulvivirga sp.]|nr:DJ-1/PfpI family protein [Fulvivirga sp.]